MGQYFGSEAPISSTGSMDSKARISTIPFKTRGAAVGTEEASYVVGGHETFPFRTGWLKKGFDALREDGLAFIRDDAIVRLGVGKNMVRSIRFWCLATQVAEEEPRLAGSKPLQPTQLGLKMLNDEGWDPYLEDVGSLWLLHWLLVTNRARASAWYHIFASYLAPDFTKPRLIGFLQPIAEKQTKPVSQNSIARDVDCLLRTYVPGNVSTGMLDATFDCPLSELELIRPYDKDGVYHFHIGPKESLPPHVFGFALLQFFRRYGGRRRSLNIQDCVYAPGSPGQAFRLDEDSTLSLLERVIPLVDGHLNVAETAGIVQVYLHVDRMELVEHLAMRLLDAYHREG